MKNLIIHQTFKTRKKIGQGSFGLVFSGSHIKTKEEVAIKLEKAETDSSLLRECEVLKDLQGIKGIPKLFWSGTEQG